MRALIPVLLFAASASAQSGGVIRGVVSLKGDGPLHHATVIVSGLGRSTNSGDDGFYEFRDVPPGSYELVAHMHSLTDSRRTVQVSAGSVTEVDFQLGLAPVRQEVTVTASGVEETTLDAFQTVSSLEGHELRTRASSASLGDLLDHETGIAKRSFGPGSTRPVVRGFDGDRVLILQDGMRSGTLSSQSGDHGEPVDASSIERLEVVRGPATLLYGSSAIGGVVNVLSSHHQLDQHPHEGVRGSVTGVAGTANGQGGGSGNVEFGLGNWLLWATGGGQRTGDYNTPEGVIENSGSNIRHAGAGTGRYSERGSFTINYGLQDGAYGVPFAGEFHAEEEPSGWIEEEHEEVRLDWRRHNLRFNGTLHTAAFLEQISTTLNYSDWNHKELEGAEIGTDFFNKQFTWQGIGQQRPRGIFSGKLGVWGLHRDFEARGEEALAPPVKQNAFAAFALEEIRFERVGLQFGGRLEHNSYNTRGARDRAFTGASGAAGVRFALNENTAFVTNYTHSFRAPALEELYNNGPHIGNLVFEVGNDNLRGERGDGIELALRHRSSKLQAETNFFYNRLRNFVFLAPTGEVEDGLIEADYEQANARFVGVEARLNAALHPNLWLRIGFDAVDAQLSASGESLPRIPPIRGRIGLDLQRGSLLIKPELILVNRQSAVHPIETETAGYVLGNIQAMYTIARQHVMHTFGATLFNVTDTLYRNHLSFIKQFAPEIGRGIRFSYTLNFY